MIAAAGPQADQFRRMFATPDGRAAIRRSLLTRKTWDKLVELVSSEKSPDTANEAAQSEETEIE